MVNKKHVEVIVGVIIEISEWVIEIFKQKKEKKQNDNNQSKNTEGKSDDA